MSQKNSRVTKQLLGPSVPFVTLCACLLLSAAGVNAASLFGKVIEVSSGDVITIINLNRPVRIRLLGVVAPEMDQAFGAVAKKHLADLVYDKSVLVEYAGIAGDYSLTGRVLLEGADIGAQMIRDGAAWVDPGTQHRLSATDREVYQQSERAARSERRGLWQEENPIAPWDFARAVALKSHPVVSGNPAAPAEKVGPNRPIPELNSLILIASHLSAAEPNGTRNLKASDLPGILMPVDGGKWYLLRPARENFSVLVPEEGEQKTVPVPAGDRLADGHLYRGRDGRAAFIVTWLTTPTYGELDTDAIRNTLASFLKGFGSSFEANSPGQAKRFTCEIRDEKIVSMHGFVGLEFDLQSCTLPARARVFTRTVDSNRQTYLAIAFHLEPDDNVSRFINSFTIVQPGSQKSPKAKK